MFVILAMLGTPLPSGQAFFRSLPPLPNGKMLSLALGSLGECDTGGRLWPGALLMCRWLSSENLDDIHVLELGSGTGAVGLYAAALGAPHVTLTDGQEAVLKLAQTNADANHGRGLWTRDTTVEVLSLPWGSALPAELAQRTIAYDLILGASITYTTELHSLLCESLWKLLSHHSPDARVVLSHDKRVPVPVGEEEASFPDVTMDHLMRTANGLGLSLRSFHAERVGGRLVSLIEVSLLDLESRQDAPG